jgi:uncharacterized protein YkwD
LKKIKTISTLKHAPYESLTRVRLLFFLSMLIIFNPLSYAQRNWNPSYYNELNDDNFRSFAPFNRPIDLEDPDYQLINAAVFFVSNEARIEQDLSPLAYQDRLEIMAWHHSKSMAEEDFFDHIHRKSRKRRTPEKRAKLAGIQNPMISENITTIGGSIFNTYLELADAIVDNWIDSPPHRKALYSKDAVQLGCGVYYYAGIWQKNKDIFRQGGGFWLATQNFQLFTKVDSKTSQDKLPK